MEQKSFYKIIFKNTGLFGISQVIKIGAKLFSNKVAAVFLGSAGIGIIGLLENILNLIQGFTNFGISGSSVREIAVADQESTRKKSDRLIKVVYKWAFVTGVIGLVVVLIFSRQIQETVFNDNIGYLWISLLAPYFLFTSLSSIRIAVLQAKKRIHLIVKYHILSAISASIIAATGYYLYGIDGIIPVIVITAFSTFLLSLFFTKSIKLSTDTITFKQAYLEGLPMAKLGLLLSTSVIFGQICFYIIRWFLKEYQSLEVLGIYQVSNTILMGYLGLVFAAMANDYYPRLCNYENDQKNFNNLINDQTEIALLLVVPAVLIFYLIAPFLITVLYTSEFLSVLNILKVGLLAIILKAIVWPLGFIPLVKGHKLLFLKQNILGDGVNVIASLVLFYYFNLLGLGIAMVIMFIVSGIYNYYVARKYYNFKYKNTTLKTMNMSLIVAVLLIIIILTTPFKNFNVYIILLTLVSVVTSFFQLKKRLKF